MTPTWPSKERPVKTKLAVRATLIVSLLGAFSPAFAQTQAASTTQANDLSPVDKAFVQAASESSSTEIDTAKLATKLSQDKDVKEFAHQMTVDHTKLTVQLKMAAPHGVAVPKDNSDPAVLNALKPLKGKAFDTAYIKSVGLEGHQKAVAAFQKEAQEGQNANLKNAATKALPTIQHHLEMAQALAAKKGVQ
jgi:putative membrane protein